MAYEIVYSPEAFDHLKSLPKAKQALMADAVDAQLADQPKLPTRRRKLLRPNPLAPWELRLGELRAFYDVQDDPVPVVTIKAVGIKHHNELWIGGERIEL